MALSIPREAGGGTSKLSIVRGAVLFSLLITGPVSHEAWSA